MLLHISICLLYFMAVIKEMLSSYLVFSSALEEGFSSFLQSRTPLITLKKNMPGFPRIPLL